MTDNSLREYYIKLHELYTNGVNLLTALNQSLVSNSSEVSVNIVSNNNVVSTLRIPSFLYLDSKIEQLETTINNLFEMPKSGEAWFNNVGNMYKLSVVRPNVAPVRPDIDNYLSINAYSKLNTFLKDLVSPSTYLRLSIPNLPHNITEMYMKKIVILNYSLYYDISEKEALTYNDYVALLYNYTKGVDYEEYDSTLTLPIKQNKYNSSFKINSIIVDAYKVNSFATQLTYKLELNTLTYTNTDDSTITYGLQIGDRLSLGDELAIYKIIDIDYSTSTVLITEEIGHVSLQPYIENQNMVFQVYNYTYDEFNYVDVPLEEDQYIAVFLSTIYNGVRSQFSNAILLNLDNVYMVNENGAEMTDGDGNYISYKQYYDKYCTNVGDLILGLSQTAYPQLTNYNANQLNLLVEGLDIKDRVNATISNKDEVLAVVPINNHIYEDGVIQSIKDFHAQKNELQAQLATITENINANTNTLLTTDWSVETSLTQNKVQAQLQTYYSERLTLEKQLNSVVNELNVLSKENNVNSATKYRIRGVTDVYALESYVKTAYGERVEIIGLDVEYKYKSISKEVTDLKNINNNVFTDWNKMPSIDRQRRLIFNSTTNAYAISFVNYDSIANIIKWNQIDIPITVGEDVVIRVRYKYNIGQPFINIYSPWSDEVTVSFPTEYIERVELPAIVTQNENDVYEAKFTSKLINDGYESHITNNLVVSNQTFYHMPENIYSGFNTPENNLLSLKDKLTLMCSDIASYSDLVLAESKKKMSVYLQYDGKTVELFDNTTNKITIDNSEHSNVTFVKKEMNLIIRNTGEAALDLYSILPGQTDIKLVHCNYDYYLEKKKAYEKLPIFKNNEIQAQTLGQWIYFRETNVYTGESVLYNKASQISYDKNKYNETKQFTGTGINDIESNYLGKDNCQLGLPSIKQISDVKLNKDNNYLGFITIHTAENKDTTINVTSNILVDVPFENDKYIYYTADGINAIYKYEDYYFNQETIDARTKARKIKKVYLDNKTPIETYILNAQKQSADANTLNGITKENFEGAFLFVNLDNNMSISTNGGEEDSYELKVGESVSIPVVFEYYFCDKETITKTLMFDIRKSLIKNPANYILEITANNRLNVADIEYEEE